MASLRTEKAIKKVIEARKAGKDISVRALYKKTGGISLKFIEFGEVGPLKEIATFTLASLIAKRGPKKKKK